MVAPLLIPLIIAGAGAVAKVAGGAAAGWAQIQQAKAQGRIDEQTYRQLEAIYQKINENYRLPPGTAEPLTFEEFRLVGTYTPEVATLIQEKAPQLVTERGAAREIASQRAALSDYEALAKTGDDAISRAAREQAAFEADQKLKSMRAAVLRDRAARGMLGSGDALLAELQGADTSAITARQQGLQAAAEAQQRRLQALAAQTGLATQMRGQAGQTERANVEIMNSFNRRMAQDQNVYNQYAAGVRNQAQMYNLGQEQSIANANVAGRTNIKNTNLIRQQEAQNSLRNALNERLLMEGGQEKDLAMMRGQLATNQAAIQNAPMQILAGTLSGAGASAMQIAPLVSNYAAMRQVQAPQAPAAAPVSAPASAPLNLTNTSASEDEEYRKWKEQKYGR